MCFVPLPSDSVRVKAASRDFDFFVGVRAGGGVSIAPPSGEVEVGRGDSCSGVGMGPSEHEGK